MVAEGLPGSTEGKVYRVVFLTVWAGSALFIGGLAALLWLFGTCVNRHRRRQQGKLRVPDDVELDETFLDKEDQSRSRMGCCLRAVLVFLFLLSFLLYLMLGLLGLGEDSWAWRVSVVVGQAAVVGAVMVATRRTIFFRGLMAGLPWVVAFYTSIAAVQLAMWDVVAPGTAAVLAVLPQCVALGHWACCQALAEAARDEDGGAWTLQRGGRGGSLDTLRRAVTGRPRTILGGLAVIVLAVALTTSTLTSTCIAFYQPLTKGGSNTINPILFSTWMSRLSLAPSCPEGAPPCHIYLTAGHNLSEAVFVNAHTSPGSPDLEVVFLAAAPSAASATASASAASAPALPAAVPMTRFTVPHLEYNGRRDVHSALLDGLAPATTYTVMLRYSAQQAGSVVTPISPIRFRTGPGGDEDFSFTSGGDAGNTPEARLITTAAGAQEPLFATVGGDLAYGNGMASCYRCWDQWFDDWQQRMVTPSGLTVPLLPVVGNHDAGTNSGDGAYDGVYPFAPNDPRMPLFFYFFPSEQTLVPPERRPPYHSHVVGTSTVLLALDSGYVVEYGGEQRRWLDDHLTAHRSTPVKAVVYHVPIFPFGRGSDPRRPEVPDGLQQWVPLFDKHRVTLALENHVHTFKRTHPLRAGDPHPNGTVYLGDGYWGIEDGVTSSGGEQKPLQTNPHPLIAVGGLRYHVWRLDVHSVARPTAVVNVSAIAGVPCPELRGEVCDGVFDRTTLVGVGAGA